MKLLSHAALIKDYGADLDDSVPSLRIESRCFNIEDHITMVQSHRVKPYECTAMNTYVSHQKSKAGPSQSLQESRRATAPCERRVAKPLVSPHDKILAL